MSAIRDARLPLTLDRVRHLYFSLHVIDELQDKFGSFDRLDEVLKGKESIKNLCWLLTRLINEGEMLSKFLETGKTEGAEVLEERIVALLINTSNFNELKTAVYKAFALGHSGDAEPGAAEPDDDEDENEAGDEKNAEAGGGK
jgi:hypothetical protein